MRDVFSIGNQPMRAMRFLFLGVICCCCGLIGYSAAYGEDVEPDESAARKATREANMQLMLKRARGMTIKVAKDADQPEIALIPKPLFHYTDEPRRIIDATMWGWTQSGRLIALCKIEKYDFPAERMWLYCFGSLSTDLVEANWLDGSPWTAKKPGVKFQPIETKSLPTKDLPGRLRQMKELANRFEATIVVDETNVDTQQMRLLPRPIYRYEKPEGKILDGAVFGLTTNGTNPDAILIIELIESSTGTPQWMFAASGMTAGALSVKLDQKEVWTKPFAGNVGRFDTWLWFFGRPSVGG